MTQAHDTSRWGREALPILIPLYTCIWHRDIAQVDAEGGGSPSTNIPLYTCVWHSHMTQVDEGRGALSLLIYHYIYCTCVWDRDITQVDGEWGGSPSTNIQLYTCVWHRDITQVDEGREALLY